MVLRSAMTGAIEEAQPCSHGRSLVLPKVRVRAFHGRAPMFRKEDDDRAKKEGR